MAGKGHTKSTKGCNTCKIRKVKCDESRPRCRKCSATGRSCAYEQDNRCISTLPGLSRYRPREVAARNSHEGRALQFFWAVVGPVLSDATDTYFWSVLLAQFSHYEPTVRHALVAVSALYEQMHRKREPLNQTIIPPNNMAMVYYNTAIRELVVSRNEALTILVCVLFTCVEFIQGNHATAIQHCRHGITIFNASFSQNESGSYLSSSPSWMTEHIFPILRRLSIVPLFFGASVASFPCINGLYDAIPGMFQTVIDAQHALDNLICRSMRFVRSSYEYRSLRSDQFASPPMVPQSLRAEQAALQIHLEAWYQSFLTSYSDLVPLSSDNNSINSVIRLKIKHRVAKIWVDMALQRDEEACETCLADFTTMAHLAMEMDGRQAQQAQRITQRGPKFVEMGFLPLLYFVVLRYQAVDLRVANRCLIKALSVYKKNLWHLDRMNFDDGHVIELDHDITLETIYSPPQGIRLYVQNIKSQ